MKNILLIENKEKIINQVVNALNIDEYYLHLAETGSKGYELALKNLPNLVICNYDIYKAVGNEVLKRLRDETFVSTIPFVFIVDKKSAGAQNKKSEFDLEYFLKKPFTDTEILEVVQLAFERYDAFLENTEKKLDSLRGSISFSLPHEFFTPLNGILGFSEILVKDFDNLGKHEMIQMLKYINKDAGRLKKLTENFLSFAQLEMIAKDPDKVIALRKSYFINPKEIITSSAKQIAKEHVRDDDLILELEDSPIRMGEGYVKKLSNELIDNAFKFSEKGTPIFVTLMSNDTSTMISISDSGRGMTPEQIGSIGAYMQFNRKIHEQQGSGLGLIMSKKITELHGGEFIIESILEEGTKINMIFDNT